MKTHSRSSHCLTVWLLKWKYSSSVTSSHLCDKQECSVVLAGDCFLNLDKRLSTFLVWLHIKERDEVTLALMLSSPSRLLILGNNTIRIVMALMCCFGSVVKCCSCVRFCCRVVGRFPLRVFKPCAGMTKTALLGCGESADWLCTKGKLCCLSDFKSPESATGLCVKRGDVFFALDIQGGSRLDCSAEFQEFLPTKPKKHVRPFRDLL